MKYKRITKANYFKAANGVLSTSKIKDYLLDPNYFYRKHVLGEFPPKITDALIMGSAIDLWLTDSYEKFNKIISKGTSKMQAYTNIAEDKKISVNSVIKDINNIKK